MEFRQGNGPPPRQKIGFLKIKENGKGNVRW